MEKGLEDRFRKMVESYSERLYWHVRSIVGSHDDADDLLQDIFLKAWKALPSFRGESSEYTWLWRIATNEALQFLGKENRRRAIAENMGGRELEGKASGIEADPYFNGDEAERKIRDAIAALPPKQRSVFCMRYYEDMSYEDISSITGTSVGALKASYHFAQEKIRIKLDREI